jgi:hypothetical protein
MLPTSQSNPCRKQLARIYQAVPTRSTTPAAKSDGLSEGGNAGFPGEIEFRGALLCARHAKQAEIYERIDLLHGVVLSTELCLKVVSLHSNRNRALLLRRQRDRAARELDLAYENLRRFENNDP